MRINNTKLIRIVTDNPFIRISELALKLEIPRSTVKKRVYVLRRNGRLVLQKRGKHAHIVTSYYARKNHVPSEYVDDEKDTLELQMLWDRLIRGAV